MDTLYSVYNWSGDSSFHNPLYHLDCLFSFSKTLRIGCTYTYRVAQRKCAYPFSGVLLVKKFYEEQVERKNKKGVWFGKTNIVTP